MSTPERAVDVVTRDDGDTATAVHAVTALRPKAPHTEHFAQFYLDERVLIESLAEYVRRGVDDGAAAVVIATEPHREALDVRWRSIGFDAATARDNGQLVLMDAERVLTRFMVDGEPDRERFFASVGGIISQATRRERRVVAFGEMVASLWKAGHTDAAVRLEQLWNELAQHEAFTLFCAYSLQDCSDERHIKPFEAVCASHTHVIPVESYVTLSPQEQQKAIALLQQKAHVLEKKLDQETEIQRAMARAEEQLRESEQALREANAALQSRAAEFARFNQAAVGRELRLIELKGEVNQLRERLGECARYSLELDPEPYSPPALPERSGSEGLVPLESILRTEQLRERPARPPDYSTENRALTVLVQALADSPRTILQTLADQVLEALHAGSAGLSLLTKEGERFYWAAIAGQWPPHLGGGTPRDFGPCGDVLDCNRPLLFTHWEACYPYLATATPLAEEGLLVPFHVAGRAVGTIWAIAHDAQRKFDAEDLRLLESLGRFASAAYQAVELTGAREQHRAAVNLLEDAVEARQLAEDANRRLREEIAQRKHIEEEMDEANRRKDEFLAMLAHELRNPLAPISNASALLLRMIDQDERAKLAIEMIKRQTTQLTRLVDDLLDVSRITQGRIQLRRRPIDLASVIAQAVETVEPQLRGKQHEISVTTSGSLPLYVNGDLARLVQCVGNILTNAVKYTEPHGEIRVLTRHEGSSAIIEIADTGSGIAPELLPRIFDLFVQSDRTLDRAQGGLGIGLAVVKRLVEMHDGQVMARSPGIGHGSVFEIRLPRIARPAAASAEAPQFEQAPKRVLIVDDNADAANSLAMLLSSQGHETQVAYSGQEALQRVESFRPEVALLDIGLPRMNGYELAQRLRAMPELNGLRLVALTGYGQAEDQQRTRAAGFDDHLVKPVDLPALASTLAGIPAGGGVDSGDEWV